MCLSLSHQYENVGWDYRQAEVNQNYGPLRAYVPNQREKECGTLKFNGKMKNSLSYIWWNLSAKENIKTLSSQEYKYKKVFKLSIILTDPIL